MTANKVNELEDNRYCSLCGSKNFELVIDGKYGKVVKCTECGLMYRKTMIGRYPVEFLGGLQHFSSQIETKQAMQIKDEATCFPIIKNILGEFAGKRLLEIGSYYGHFLDYARKLGFIVTGLDPDTSLAEIARKRFNLEIIDGFLQDAHIGDESYDVVVMFHVIEHMNDPLKEMKEINRIMKRGGIFIAETPRYDTLWFKILREHERSVIPEHFTFFTKNSFSQMVTKAGFNIIQLDTVGRTLTFDRLLTQVSKMVGSKFIAKKVLRMSEFLHFEKITFYLNMGDMMRIYARKV